ncbi:MAG: membrane integrity-associated transporter subunit PqiC, partial [Deltaproteobacteria bacterium]|nr:membrane integrity-associated transporter subunit PqiC [Deltaproteobacteria bacterium]
DYLKRQQIANRIDENEILFSDFKSWAEPLDRCVTRVLSENLSVLLNTERIEVYPWLPSLPVDYQIRVRIARFDGTTDEEAVLVVYWSLYGRDNAMLADHKSVISEKIDAGGYTGLVQAQNRALEKLSREIAAALQKLAR